MTTIAAAVRNIIKENPFLEEALHLGLVKHSALALHLQDKVERWVDRKVKFSTINIAVRRFAEHLYSRKHKSFGFSKDSDITLRSDLCEITVFKLGETSRSLERLYSMINLRDGDFLTVTQGMNEITIVINSKHLKKAKELFSKNLKSIIEGLGILSIKMDEKAIETPGLFYLATRALMWNSVNIIDIISTFTEMTFVLRERDLSKSFDILSELIRED